VTLPARRAMASARLGFRHPTIGGHMHAVVVRVKIDDFDAARQRLKEDVVPRASQAPGFVAGYWTRSQDGGNGMAMILFESEESASGATEMIRAAANDDRGGVSLEGVEVREVVEHA
jgi:hypothetical protein